ncbi:MAG: hypothetical protein VYD57_19100 [Pseudomonadota bacterium]|nr:hypothetical protein [Pseudomonadota bacterium]
MKQTSLIIALAGLAVLAGCTGANRTTMDQPTPMEQRTPSDGIIPGQTPSETAL